MHLNTQLSNYQIGIRLLRKPMTRYPTTQKNDDQISDYSEKRLPHNRQSRSGKGKSGLTAYSTDASMVLDDIWLPKEKWGGGDLTDSQNNFKK